MFYYILSACDGTKPQERYIPASSTQRKKERDCCYHQAKWNYFWFFFPLPQMLQLVYYVKVKRDLETESFTVLMLSEPKHLPFFFSLIKCWWMLQKMKVTLFICDFELDSLFEAILVCLSWRNAHSICNEIPREQLSCFSSSNWHVHLIVFILGACSFLVCAHQEESRPGLWLWCSVSSCRVGKMRFFFPPSPHAGSCCVAETKS